jgi:TfoX/Sxy family transcriptional regulator of competence genes
VPGSTAETAFERIAVRLMNVPGVSAGTMFGASALKFRGKVFAMLVKGRLVVKLPTERVTRLVSAGSGQLFDPGNGRLMKEWVTIPDRVRVRWSGLVDEAEVFVSLGDKSARPRVRAVRRPALATKRRDARRRDQRAGNDRALTTETGDPR